MERKFTECNPTVCNRDFILSDDGDIMDKDTIKKQCECVKKSTCFEVLRLLNEKKIDEAVDVLSANR